MIRNCLEIRHSYVRTPWIFSLVCSLTLACTGSVGSTGNHSRPPANEGEPGEGEGLDWTNEDRLQGPGDKTACEPNAIKPRVWRLTPLQYANTLRDSFGIKTDAANLTPDPQKKQTGFSNEATTIFASERHVSEYFDLAFEASDQLIGGLSGASACVLADNANDACIDAFIASFGQRAFRRPLLIDEVERYRTFRNHVRADHGAKAAARMVLAALLQAPEFIYRTELGSGEGTSVTLTPFERATAMAYGLTDTPPSQELLEAAAAGELSNRDSIERWARGLVNSQAGREKFTRFVFSWLHMDELLRNQQSNTDDVASTTRFIDDILNDEQASLANLFVSSRWHVSPALAETYVVEPGKALDASLRFGLLTQSSFLKSHQNTVKRSVHFLRDLLCTELPEPPPDAANGGFPNLPGATDAEIYDRFLQTHAACAGCHRTFQPLGIAFSRYDSLGRYRTHNEAKQDVSSARPAPLTAQKTGAALSMARVTWLSKLLPLPKCAAA